MSFPICSRDANCTLLAALLLTGPVAVGPLAAQVMSLGGHDQAITDPLASVNFHLMPFDPSVCAIFDESALGRCEHLTSSPLPGMSTLWIVLNREGGFPDGVGGIGMGIAHQNLDLLGWVNCTGGLELVFGPWPASGTGIVTFWPNACHYPPGESAKVGFLVLGSALSGTAAAIDNPIFNPLDLQWGTCSVPEDISVCLLNRATVDLAAGIAPLCGDNCVGPTPVVAASWSAIKSHYR